MLSDFSGTDFASFTSPAVLLAPVSLVELLLLTDGGFGTIPPLWSKTLAATFESFVFGASTVTAGSTAFSAFGSFLL